MILSALPGLYRTARATGSSEPASRAARSVDRQNPDVDHVPGRLRVRDVAVPPTTVPPLRTVVRVHGEGRVRVRVDVLTPPAGSHPLRVHRGHHGFRSLAGAG